MFQSRIRQIGIPQRLKVVVNSVCARVCPVSAQSMDSRSAVGWVMSMSTAYNLNTYRCEVPIGGQGG
jgi:formate hydrogenlyase subunit 6/NADH:ubiquinone oxidoreductase subunit I